MGSYLNPSNKGFRQSLQSKIYVDKSMLIARINEVLDTEQKFICVSRPRRFGKSMAANMLAAYYGSGEDTAPLFDKLKIAGEASYKEHLNQYDVIKINMQSFLSSASRWMPCWSACRSMFPWNFEQSIVTCSISIRTISFRL